MDATEKGSTEYDTEKEAADAGEKDSDSNNLSNQSSPNKTVQLVNEIMEKEELKLALDAANEKDSDKQSDNEEGSKQSIKPYVFEHKQKKTERKKTNGNNSIFIIIILVQPIHDVGVGPLCHSKPLAHSRLSGARIEFGVSLLLIHPLIGVHRFLSLSFSFAQ